MKEIFIFFVCTLFFVLIILNRKQKNIKQNISVLMKDEVIIQLQHQWIRILQDGKVLAEYFERRHFYHIAVYGMGYLGRALLSELSGSSIKVDYIIDQNEERRKGLVDYPFYSSSDTLPKVDVIVITPIMSVAEVKQVLNYSADQAVISIETVIYNLLSCKRK